MATSIFDDVWKGPEPNTRILDRTYHINDEFDKSSITPAIGYLEELILRVAADEKLPLLVNHKWMFKENEQYYKERLANARLSLRKE